MVLTQTIITRTHNLMNDLITKHKTNNSITNLQKHTSRMAIQIFISNNVPTVAWIISFKRMDCVCVCASTE